MTESVAAQRVSAPYSFPTLSDAPMDWARYGIWLLASGGTLLDGFSVVSLGLALPLLSHDFTISPLTMGLIGSALVLGAVLGAIFGGMAADRYGRKHVFLADMAIVVIGAALCALASEQWLVLIGQFVLGIGIGIDFPTSGAYVLEMMPTKARRRMTVATIALQSVGMVIAALIGMAILRTDAAGSDWRLLLGAVGMIAAAFLVGRMRLPESPRWLADKGRMGEANAILRELSAAASPSSPQAEVPAAPAQRTPWQAAPITEPAELGLGVLFSEPYRVRTLLVSLPWTLMDVATYGVGLFTPIILATIHLSVSGGGPIAADFANAEGSAAVDLFLVVGFAVGLWAIPRFGRLPMQVAGFAGMALGMLLLLFAALSTDGSHKHIGLIIGGFVLFNFAMNAGPNATTFTLAPVLFPTAIRASASGFAASCAKIGATFGIFAVPQLQAATGLAGVLALMVFVSIAGLIATAAFAYAVDEDRLDKEIDGHPRL